MGILNPEEFPYGCPEQRQMTNREPNTLFFLFPILCAAFFSDFTIFRTISPDICIFSASFRFIQKFILAGFMQTFIYDSTMRMKTTTFWDKQNPRISDNFTDSHKFYILRKAILKLVL